MKARHHFVRRRLSNVKRAGAFTNHSSSSAHGSRAPSCRRPRFAFATATAALIAGAALFVSPALPAAAAEACPNEGVRAEGQSIGLPDCRAFERVSPPGEGVDAVPVGDVTFPAQASSRESAFAYMNLGFPSDPAGGQFPSAYLAIRGAAGWRTEPLTPRSAAATPASTTEDGYGYDFTPDLSQMVLKAPPPTVTDDATPGVYNLYLRHPDGTYSLLTTAIPSELPPANCALCFNEVSLPAFAGGNAGSPTVPAFSHLLFEANSQLDAGAPGGGVENLYEASDGGVNLVGVLPDGTIAPGGSTPGAGLSVFYSSFGFRFTAQRLEHAISADGSHIFFQAASDEGEPDEAGQAGMTELYARIEGTETIEISAPAPGAAPPNPAAEPAQFWSASAGGSVIYFTSSAELTDTSTTGPGNEGGDLYRYDLAGHQLTDLTPDVADAAGAQVQGVVGASEDGSYVYFTALGQLDGADGVVGEPNLYVSRDGGSPIFIATLTGADERDWSPFPADSQAYVTPDGQHLAFMSVNSLTGSDNIDQNTGEADSEVYLYDASDVHLACASCDGANAPPVGSSFIGAKLEEGIGTAFHQIRSVSDDGSRLFFSSPNSLAPGAGGTQAKIYEYEDGADHLISGIGNRANEMFLDADPTGANLFFASRSRLIPGEDQGSTVNVYDARVDGGFPREPSASNCAGEACRPEPSASIIGEAIGSNMFYGATNHKPKRRHRRKKNHHHRSRRQPGRNHGGRK